MARFDEADIRRYYDRHTSRFVSLGQGGRVGAIHRAVWGPGVRDRDQAFHYVEDRLVERLRDLSRPIGTAHVVDLGCGVGASVCYLASRLPIRATGVTLSPVQAQRAGKRIRDAGLSDRVACIEGDFCDLPIDVEPADLAYAIESFVHGPTPSRFFEQCARLVRPGGVLAVCDDVLQPAAGPEATRSIECFCRGWHLNSLIPSDEFSALARAAGFELESTTNLSPYLEIHRPRDRAINVILAILGRLPVNLERVAPLLGGSALQTCLARGWVRYDLMFFRRDAVPRAVSP